MKICQAISEEFGDIRFPFVTRDFYILDIFKYTYLLPCYNVASSTINIVELV